METPQSSRHSRSGAFPVSDDYVCRATFLR